MFGGATSSGGSKRANRQRAMTLPPLSRACAWCAKEAEPGRKLAVCGRCDEKNLPTTRYCSEACQVQHWEGGHQAWHAEVAQGRKARKEVGLPQLDREVAEDQMRQAERTGSKYSRLLAEGVAHLANNHLRYAERSFRKAIKLNPVEPVGYFNLGSTLRRAADYVNAADAFVQASELYPDGSEGWAYSIAVAFASLIQPDCKEAPKPEWWHDEALKELSARVVEVAPNSLHTTLMRANVLGGRDAAWERGPRTAAELKEAASCWRRAAKMRGATADEKTRWTGRAAELDDVAEAMEAEEAAAAEAREVEEEARRREAEDKANAAADALLAEEAAEKAAAARSGGKAKGKKKGKGKR